MASDAYALLRQEWDEGDRALEAERHDRPRYERLLEQVEIVTDELRRRIGQTYSLDELAREYRGAERWAREVVAERATSPGWTRDVALVLAAAFHAYQRGATDYLA
jgi:hypothetical protein